MNKLRPWQSRLALLCLLAAMPMQAAASEDYAAQVSNAYVRILERQPDQWEIDTYVDVLTNEGKSIEHVHRIFRESPEYKKLAERKRRKLLTFLGALALAALGAVAGWGASKLPPDSHAFRRLAGSMLPVVALLTFLVRLIAIHWSDLPIGDEINVYIRSGQTFAHTGTLPSLSQHPGVAILYGVIVKILNVFSVPLPGVQAHRFVSVMAPTIAVFFLWHAVAKLAGRKAAFLCALLYATFPGLLSPLRGDLALYQLFYLLMLYFSIKLIQSGKWRWAAALGLAGGLLYICRSDGLVLVPVFVLLFAALFARRYKRLLLSVGCFILVPCLFLGVYRVQHKSFGPATGSRAFEAFYQAEGLHDQKGGSWQDYTDRGRERFGPPEAYDGSMLKLAARHPGAIWQRTTKNMSVLRGYIRRSSGLAAWLVLLLSLSPLLMPRVAKGVYLFTLPAVITCCTYFVFYFQQSYYVMFSTGLVLAAGCGIYAIARILGRTSARPWLEHAVVAAVSLLVVVFLPTRALRAFPGYAGRTTYERYVEVLAHAGRLYKEKPRHFFAPAHGGSRAMAIYADAGAPWPADEDILRLEGEALHAALMEKRIEYVLAAREHENLWNLDPVFASPEIINEQGDAKLLRLLTGDGPPAGSASP